MKINFNIFKIITFSKTAMASFAPNKRGGRGRQRQQPHGADVKTQSSEQNEPGAELVCAEEWRIRRHLPPHLPRRPQDVYITRRTAFRAQLERCRRLLREFDPTFANSIPIIIFLSADLRFLYL